MVQNGLLTLDLSLFFLVNIECVCVCVCVCLCVCVSVCVFGGQAGKREVFKLIPLSAVYE